VGLLISSPANLADNGAGGPRTGSLA